MKLIRKLIITKYCLDMLPNSPNKQSKKGVKFVKRVPISILMIEHWVNDKPIWWNFNNHVVRLLTGLSVYITNGDGRSYFTLTFLQYLKQSLCMMETLVKCQVTFWWQAFDILTHTICVLFIQRVKMHATGEYMIILWTYNKFPKSDYDLTLS